MYPILYAIKRSASFVWERLVLDNYRKRVLGRAAESRAATGSRLGFLPRS